MKDRNFKKVLFLLCCIFNTGVYAQKMMEPEARDFYEYDLARLYPATYVPNRFIVTFKEPVSEQDRIVQRPDVTRRGTIPFGMHSSGQSREEVANTLELQGEVLKIFDTINAIYIEADRNEANRLRNDPRVALVEQDMIDHSSGTQNSPGWGLDRLDESGPSTGDGTYNYTYTGSGRTIYILDTGLNVEESGVISEFGSRASVIYDYNDGDPYGEDCNGHGSMVASAAGSATYGVAKGVTIIMAKITIECSGSAYTSESIAALNWLAANEDPGTIVNWSRQFVDETYQCTPIYNSSLENAFGATYEVGILNVVAAGNDGCDTDDYSPTALADTFVVGATAQSTSTYDPIASFSRRGENISTFAPGVGVALMTTTGGSTTNSGTSFSAPYIAGIMAVVCEAEGGTPCESGDTEDLYEQFRDTGTLDTVTESNGDTLVGATSRFIWQQW